MSPRYCQMLPVSKPGCSDYTARIPQPRFYKMTASIVAATVGKSSQDIPTSPRTSWWKLCQERRWAQRRGRDKAKAVILKCPLGMVGPVVARLTNDGGWRGDLNSRPRKPSPRSYTVKRTELQPSRRSTTLAWRMPSLLEV